MLDLWSRPCEHDSGRGTWCEQFNICITCYIKVSCLNIAAVLLALFSLYCLNDNKTIVFPRTDGIFSDINLNRHHQFAGHNCLIYVRCWFSSRLNNLRPNTHYHQISLGYVSLCHPALLEAQISVGWCAMQVRLNWTAEGSVGTVRWLVWPQMTAELSQERRLFLNMSNNKPLQPALVKWRKYVAV